MTCIEKNRKLKKVYKSFDGSYQNWEGKYFTDCQYNNCKESRIKRELLYRTI